MCLFKDISKNVQIFKEGLNVKDIFIECMRNPIAKIVTQVLLNPLMNRCILHFCSSYEDKNM